MFQELWNSVNLFNIKKQEYLEIVKYEKEYLPTDFQDIITTDDSNSEMYTVLKDGSIRKTVLYISERPYHHLEKGYLPKYHIFDCENLQKSMREGKKYKKTSPTNENFLVLFGEQRKIVSLSICGTCFKLYIAKYPKLSYNITLFLSQGQESDFDKITIKDSFDSIPKIYAKNWQTISSQLKRLKNYTCEDCGINLVDNQYYLHTHHINSNPRDNIMTNLKVLCIECHAEQVGHGHMKELEDYNQYIKLKQENKI
jgi:hypothetical protein